MDLPVKRQEQILEDINGVDFIVIKSDENYADAASFLSGLKKTMKEWKDLRVSFTKPLDESKKRIMDFFRPASDKMDDAERRVKIKMSEWVLHKEQLAREIALENEKKRQEAIKEAEKADEDFDFDKKSEKIIEANAIETIESTLKDGKAKADGISTSKKWCFEVTDFSKLPDEYKIADDGVIRKEVVALKEKTSIPGVRVYTETVIRAR